MIQLVPEKTENGQTPIRGGCVLSLGWVILFGSIPAIPLSAEGPLIATPVEISPSEEKPTKRRFFFRRSKSPVSENKKDSSETKPIVAKPVIQTTQSGSRFASSDSLPGLIREALQNNPELQSIRQDEIIQLAKSEFTRKDAFPLLAVYGTHDSQPPSTIGGRNNLRGRSERDGIGFTAEQPLLDWGETGGKIEMERHRAGSHRWSAKVKELETVYAVTEAYWRLVFFKEVVRLRKAALAAKRNEKSSIAEQVNANVARKADLLVVEAAVAMAEQELLKAHNGLDLSTAQLLFYLGRKSHESVSVHDRLTVDRFPASAAVCVDSHPEMKQVRFAEMAASDAERSARAGRLPKVILRGHIEDSKSQVSAGTTNLVPDGTNYQVGAYVSVPVGRQWVAATARLNEAVAKRIQLAADAESISGSLQLRVRDAQNRVEEALKSVIVAEKNEAAATENLKLRKELALIKNATRADVAKAESDYNEAKVGVLKAKYDVKEARAHLDRERGIINP